MTPKRQGPEEFLDEGELFAKLGAMWDEMKIDAPPAHVWTDLPNQHADYMRAAGFKYKGHGEWIRWDDIDLTHLMHGQPALPLPGQDEEC